jgi:hypothetical protein
MSTLLDSANEEKDKDKKRSRSRLFLKLWIVKAVIVKLLLIGAFLWKRRQDHVSSSENDAPLVDLFHFTGQRSNHDKAKRELLNETGLIAASNVFLTPLHLSMPDQHPRDGRLRILYIVTSLAQYNSGKRSTEAGSDRLQETLIPVLREGVLSMVNDFGYRVDVFLIAHWTVQPERLALIRQALPDSVGLEYWDDATPIGYKLESKGTDEYVRNITRALARQHRFVIKDKFLYYDFFVNFEDDMLIKGHHVQHNLKVSQELFRLRELAPDEPQDYDLNHTSRRDLERRYYGTLTKRQLARMFPGFIRVEVLLDEENYPTQNNTGPIPVDLEFENGRATVNPSYCCHVSNETASDKMPQSPSADKLFLWETAIIALGIHKMPKESSFDYVLFQRGPNMQKEDPADFIGEYYSGRNKEFKQNKRPHPTQGMYINNMGGWMASRRQIWEWHTEICPGGFLPPFDVPHYNLDGLDLRNVEYWSGGLHLFTRQHACNMQRIITLDPDGFSKHLLYHTANNKQRQLSWRREKSFNKASTLLGQLNSLRKKAELELPPEEKS